MLNDFRVSTCDGHLSGMATTKKIILNGYFGLLYSMIASPLSNNVPIVKYTPPRPEHHLLHSIQSSWTTPFAYRALNSWSVDLPPTMVTSTSSLQLITSLNGKKPCLLSTTQSKLRLGFYLTTSLLILAFPSNSCLIMEPTSKRTFPGLIRPPQFYP